MSSFTPAGTFSSRSSPFAAGLKCVKVPHPAPTSTFSESITVEVPAKASVAPPSTCTSVPAARADTSDVEANGKRKPPL